MTSSTDPGNKSPEQIEAEVEATRARLDRTLDEIQERVAPGEIFEQAVTFARDNGVSDMARNLGRDVRDNPMPLALIGLGAAWLAFSSARSPKRRVITRDRYGRAYGPYDADDYYDEDPYAESYAAAGATYGAGTQTQGSYGGSTGSTGPSTADRAKEYADDVRVKAAGAGAAVSGSVVRLGDTARDAGSRTAHGAASAAHSAATGVSGAANRASESVAYAAGRTGDGASYAAGRVGDGVSYAGHAAGSAASRTAQGASSLAGRVGEAVSSAADTVSDYAGHAYDRLTSGASRASETGRHGYYVMTSHGRRWVEDARYGASRYGASAGRYANRAGGVLRENPLLLGALGIAIGAAIGAALPKTRFEDEYIGETADSYKRQALAYGEETYEEARERVMSVARRAYDEALSQAKKEGLTPAEAEARARQAGDRARDDARRGGAMARDGVRSAGEYARSGIASVGEAARSGLEAGVSKIENVVDAALDGATDEAKKQKLTPSDLAAEEKKTEAKSA